MSLKFEDEAAAAHARSAVAGIAVVVATAKHMLNAEAVKWQKLCRRRLRNCRSAGAEAGAASSLLLLHCRHQDFAAVSLALRRR